MWVRELCGSKAGFSGSVFMDDCMATCGVGAVQSRTFIPCAPRHADRPGSDPCMGGSSGHAKTRVHFFPTWTPSLAPQRQEPTQPSIAATTDMHLLLQPFPALGASGPHLLTFPVKIPTVHNRVLLTRLLFPSPARSWSGTDFGTPAQASLLCEDCDELGIHIYPSSAKGNVHPTSFRLFLFFVVPLITNFLRGMLIQRPSTYCT
jgi:hypothetical protein